MHDFSFEVGTLFISLFSIIITFLHSEPNGAHVAGADRSPSVGVGGSWTCQPLAPSDHPPKYGKPS